MYSLNACASYFGNKIEYSLTKIQNMSWPLRSMRDELLSASKEEFGFYNLFPLEKPADFPYALLPLCLFTVDI